MGLLRVCALAGMLVLAACSGERVAPPAVDPRTETLLIQFAADDFRQHVAAQGVRFRGVHAGDLRGDNGRIRHILCGEFRAPDQDGWNAFATIQTEPYENWLGSSAEVHCQQRGLALESKRDLSDALNARYDQASKPAMQPAGP